MIGQYVFFFSPDSVKNGKGERMVNLSFLREFNIYARWEGRNEEKRINGREHWEYSLIIYMSNGITYDR